MPVSVLNIRQLLHARPHAQKISRVKPISLSSTLQLCSNLTSCTQISSQEQLSIQGDQGIPLQSHQDQRYQRVMQMYGRLAQLDLDLQDPRRQRLQQQLMSACQVQQHEQDRKHYQASGHQDSQEMQGEEEHIVHSIAATAATDAVAPIAGAGSRTNAQDTLPQLDQKQESGMQQMATHQDQKAWLQSPSCTQQTAVSRISRGEC